MAWIRDIEHAVQAAAEQAQVADGLVDEAMDARFAADHPLRVQKVLRLELLQVPRVAGD